MVTFLRGRPDVRTLPVAPTYETPRGRGGVGGFGAALLPATDVL